MDRELRDLVTYLREDVEFSRKICVMIRERNQLTRSNRCLMTVEVSVDDSRACVGYECGIDGVPISTNFQKTK